MPVFQWNNSPEAIAKRIVSPAVKEFAASEWHRLYTPFVPMETGRLMSNVRFSDDGMIEHTEPYAVFVYNGHGARRGRHGLSAARWDQAAKSAGLTDALVQAIKEYIGNRR